MISTTRLVRSSVLLAIVLCLFATPIAVAPAHASGTNGFGCSHGMRSLHRLAVPPSEMEHALVTLETRTWGELEREIEVMRSMGVYVRHVLPPNALIVGVAPSGHSAEREFTRSAESRRWNVVRGLVDETVMSRMTGVEKDVFKLWNINYQGAGVLYGIKPQAPLPWGGEKHEKSISAVRERRRAGIEKALEARALEPGGDAPAQEPSSLAAGAITPAIDPGAVIDGPPCGSVVHSSGIRYDPIEYALGSWVISLVTPETPPDGVGGVTTNAEEEWNDSPADELDQVKSMAMLAADNMINSITGDLSIGNMSVVWNYEDQARTCCGQGKSDAECNNRCHEPIAGDSTIEQQYITDLTFPMGIDQTPIDFGPYYPHLNYIFEYNDIQRNTFNTNWAHMIFAIDSTNDSDNLFSDGYYGWNYLATGYQSSVTGVYNYGFSNYWQLAQHETTHGPGALDEYKFGGSRCTHEGGYMAVRNRNSIDGGGGCEPPVDCVMKDGPPVDGICFWTEGQTGGWDSDGDMIPDILDTIPTCSVSGAGGSFSGTASVNPLQNMNPYSYVSPAGYTAYGLTNNNGLTLNTVTNVEYSVDGGPFQPATASDGAFDGCSEGFSFSAAGTTVDVRVTNASGNTGICQAGGGGGACDDDGTCEAGEDCENCGDCAGQTTGKPSTRFCCGNGIMEGPEGDGTICDGNF